VSDGNVVSVKSVGRGCFCPVDGLICGGYFVDCARSCKSSILLVALCPRFAVIVRERVEVS
jgi:hypothetical protein